MTILTILVVSIHDHRIDFHLYVLSSISFPGVIQFLEHRYFTSLVSFIPMYFIVFDTIVNEIFCCWFLCYLLVYMYMPISIYEVWHGEFMLYKDNLSKATASKWLLSYSNILLHWNTWITKYWVCSFPLMSIYFWLFIYL